MLSRIYVLSKCLRRNILNSVFRNVFICFLFDRLLCLRSSYAMGANVLAHARQIYRKDSSDEYFNSTFYL